MEITFFGAGALGTYYGSQLAQAGESVNFIVRSEYEHWKTHGITVEGMRGIVHLPTPQVFNADNLPPPADIVVITLKTFDNASLADSLPKIVKPNGYVCTLQNGLGNEQAIARICPESHVFGGIAFLCASRKKTGHICQHTTDRLALGTFGNASQTGVDMLSRAMTLATVQTRTTPDLMATRWEKLAWNIPFNGLCTLHNLTVDQVLANSKLHAQARELYGEVITAGQHLTSWRPPADFVDKQISVSLKMGNYAPSMLLDARAKHPLEWRAIHSIPAQMARQAGCPMPQTEVLAQALSHLQ